MRYPSLNKTPQRAISVPSLSGGLNLADSLHLVNDNQLTDVKNMWFKNSMLQTRPAISNANPIDAVNIPNASTHTDYVVDLEQSIDGEKSILCVHKELNYDTDETTYTITKIVKGEQEFTVTQTLKDEIIASECFFTAKSTISYLHKRDIINPDLQVDDELEGTGIFFNASVDKKFPLVVEGTGEDAVIKETITKHVVRLCEIVKIKNKGQYFIYHYGYNDYYQPIVYLNGKGESYSELPTNETTDYAPASYYEGFSEYVETMHKFCFTTDGKSTSFKVPFDLQNMVISLKYTDTSTGKKYGTDRQYIRGAANNINMWNIDDLYNDNDKITVDFSNNTFTFDTLPPSALNGNENNFIVSVGYWYDVFKTENYIVSYGVGAGKRINDSKLYGANIAKWFGGTGKGTRLFLSGCEGKHKNIVMWSKVNEPSYISENNYNYVGTSAQKITALHKQSDMLVVFKEDELFYTQYTGQQEITESQVISGSVIDIETNSSVFPFYQIHSEIGCNIPKSIQLCGNRLVWATKNNKIYTLKSANQYSNANVFELSQTIERKLKTITNKEIELCKSCVYDGWYILSFDNKSFVLNVENYYYKNTSAYADSRQQNRKFEWFYWEFPQSIGVRETAYLVDASGCHIINFYIGVGDGVDDYGKTVDTCYVYSYLLDENETQDVCTNDTETGLTESTHDIVSLIQTKLFDFGLPDRYKKIEQVYIGFGEAANNTTISYVTDSGTKTDTIDELKSNFDDYSPEYIKTKRLLPNVNRAVRFGIRLNCLGRLSISDLIIKYKFIGGVR